MSNYKTSGKGKKGCARTLLLIFFVPIIIGIVSYMFGGAGMPSEEEVQDIHYIDTTFHMLENQYLEDGAVDEEEKSALLDEIEKTASLMLYDDKIVNYSKNENSVWIKFENGLEYMYIPRTEGYDSFPKTSYYTIYSMQPCLSMYSDAYSYEMSLPDSAAQSLDNVSSRWSYYCNYDDYMVSRSTINNLVENSIIVWHGHGAYSANTGPVLLIGEKFDEDKFQKDRKYYKEFAEGRLARTNTGEIVITSKYIDKYVGSLEGSLIYLGTCLSGTDTTLSNAFLNKGAKAVIVNSDTIRTTYNTRMIYETMNFFATAKEDGTYRTLEEALTDAKYVHGENDSVYFGGTKAAFPYIRTRSSQPLIITDYAPETSSQEESSSETPSNETSSESNTQSTPDLNAYSLLEDYSNYFNYLTKFAAVYTGSYHKEDYRSTYYSTVSTDVVHSSLIKDFDKDGQDELLLLYVNSNQKLDAYMYEVQNGEIICQASLALNADASVPMEEGLMQAMTFENFGKTMIGISEHGSVSLVGDGDLYRFSMFSYNGSTFDYYGAPEFIGSALFDDYFDNEMAQLGISVNLNSMMANGISSFYSYLPSPEIFGESVTYSLYESDSDKIAFSNKWFEDDSVTSEKVSIIEIK